MIALAIVFALLGVGLLVLASRNPRRGWQRTAAWQFRNPEAVEPSDAALGCGRVFQAVAGVAVLCFAGVLASFGFAKDADILPRVEKAAAELSAKDAASSDGLKLDLAVDRALGNTSDRGQFLSSTRVFRESRGVLYNVTLQGGKQTACLIVRQGKASAKPGACTADS
ncbi:hypothetical protein GCM10022247_05980 [Allokutzneria multivorans]|uniref:DUF6199 domain-containing protein n=1 Tax=Allokutzneria multivorans TaxID=1142134 RepID=A0ABP7QZV6_9PSEU